MGLSGIYHLNKKNRQKSEQTVLETTQFYKQVEILCQNRWMN